MGKRTGVDVKVKVVGGKLVLLKGSKVRTFGKNELFPSYERMAAMNRNKIQDAGVFKGITTKDLAFNNITDLLGFMLGSRTTTRIKNFLYNDEGMLLEDYLYRIELGKLLKANGQLKQKVSKNLKRKVKHRVFNVNNSYGIDTRLGVPAGELRALVDSIMGDRNWVNHEELLHTLQDMFGVEYINNYKRDLTRKNSNYEVKNVLGRRYLIRKGHYEELVNQVHTTLN